MSSEKSYIAIDLKSFYASVECAERNLNPLDANLIVADESRTDGTICLAVSPALKARGVPGRPRLFEVKQIVRRLNADRLATAPGRCFQGESYSDAVLKREPGLAIGYITAVPRMALYIEYSSRIYEIYLKYIAPEDIHVYSIDEVFIDATAYLKTYGKSARELAMLIIKDVLRTTGITATAGIGTNLYLAKVAMDIVAKKMPADSDGVRIAELDEAGYREKLWSHKPITDFWRVGNGYAKKLAGRGMYTMGDVALCSEYSEDILYKMFGVNAELLIDHAWGWEPCTIEEIKNYRPKSNSLSSGQVLQEAYSFERAGVVVREMADELAMNLTVKGLVSEQLSLTIGYDSSSLEKAEILALYRGKISVDYYGKPVPYHAHGSVNLSGATNSCDIIMGAARALFERICDPILYVRRINLSAERVMTPEAIKNENKELQLDFFTDYEAEQRKKEEEKQRREADLRRQTAISEIKSKFGKNAILRGLNFEDGANGRERNSQIGGHRA